MSETEYKLPTRKWYTLEQAVKRINQLTKEDIDTSDLLQYWMNHKIELCIHFHLSPAQIKINGKKLNIKDATSLYIDPTGFKAEDYYDDNIFQMIQLTEIGDGDFNGEIDVHRGESNIGMDIVIHKNNEENFNLIEQYSARFFYINGFLSLIYSSELFQGREIDIIRGNNIPFREGMLAMSTPSCIEGDRLFIEILNINDFNLQPEDLYILNDDLEDFLNNRAAPPEQPQKTKEPSRTIKENQINFIKGLLYLHYDIKTPNEAKNAMNTGKLGKDIARLKREQPGIEDDQNFKFPSSVTLFNWYGGI